MMAKRHDRRLGFWIECLVALGFVVFGSTVAAIMGVV
jgi:hypothetical protein